MKISFVIPVYQNAGSLSKTHEKIQKVFFNELKDYEYEILFVDDGSVDGSLQELLNLRDQDSKVKVITFTRNFGQQAAIVAGFRAVTGDATVNVSADLQDPIELVPQMVDKWQKGSEIVACYRIGRSDTFLTNLFAKLSYRIMRITLPKMPPGGFDFVLMDRKAVDTFNNIDVRNRYIAADILWTGYHSSFIPYVRLKRTIGKSQYNFWKKLKVFVDAMIDGSYLPIRLISLLGIITSMLGVLYSATLVYSWYRGKTPFNGWAPIMIVILLIGGLIMLMLGIIGEYIWRINEEVRKRPHYVIRKKFL